MSNVPTELKYAASHEWIRDEGNGIYTVGIYAPIAGEIVAVNEELEDSPELVNSDPYGDGWLFKIKADDETEVEGLLDAEGYAASIEED
ncbi:MAG: hypothetical protein M1473_00705 [Firmicutes bacterium]|nr:hypothetical protein [Bacillota bacterium]